MIFFFIIIINGDKQDREDLLVSNARIGYTARYRYLGTLFTYSGKMDDAIALHEVESETIVNKFGIFCVANSLMLYICKKKIFDSAVVSSLSYSSYSWF